MSYRKINIDGKIWNYVVGEMGVKIKSPVNKSTWIENYKIVGMSKEEYDKESYEIYRDDYDGPLIIPIAPSHIRKYIEEKL